MLLQIHYGLRILFWFMRVAIVIFVLIPGSIPALIVAGLTYVLSLFDPEMIFQGKFMDFYNQYFLTLPLWLQYVFTISAISLFLYIYVRFEIRRIGNSNLYEAFKIRLIKIYEKYLRFPTIELSETSEI